MIAIDLFSGAGGLAEGFSREGFKVAAHIEKEKWMCETLKTRDIYNFLKQNNDLETYFNYLKSGVTYRNFEEGRRPLFSKYSGLEKIISGASICKAFGDPNVEDHVSDIHEIIADIESAIKNVGANIVDVVIGGPPCQAFSVVARHAQNRNQDDIKLNLYTYYLEILKHFKPRMFVFENVPGILSMLNGNIFQQICSKFDDEGYTLLFSADDDVKKCIYTATEFGVCQTRRRVILLGVRKDIIAVYPDFSKYGIYNFSDLSTKTAINDLPSLHSGDNTDFDLYAYTSDAENDFQKLMRKNSCGVINHKARSNQERDLEIYKLRINGKCNTYKELPDELKTHKKQDVFEDRFRVHYWDKVPHTIMAHISKDGHYNIHPDIAQCRSLTVREAARIQSFPDNYKFEGPRTSQYVQVGNAVPPLMAQSIARALNKILE
jgi:DNA (cytosine-5)-methyltransferase 1